MYKNLELFLTKNTDKVSDVRCLMLDMLLETFTKNVIKNGAGREKKDKAGPVEERVSQDERACVEVT